METMSSEIESQSRVTRQSNGCMGVFSLLVSVACSVGVVAFGMKTR